MPDFPAASHVAVTVTDLRASEQWYTRLFGSDPVVDEDTGPWHHIAWALSDGFLFAIHAHPSTDKSKKFSEFRAGLDHISFRAKNRAELEEREKRLNELGIKHGGIVDAPYGARPLTIFNAREAW